MQFNKNQFFTWLIAGFLMFFVYERFFEFTPERNAGQISITEFTNLVENTELSSAIVTPVSVVGEKLDGTRVRSTITLFYMGVVPNSYNKRILKERTKKGNRNGNLPLQIIPLIKNCNYTPKNINVNYPICPHPPYKKTM